MLDGIKKAIFFGAHTDDEFIAAGTLHRLARSGCQVRIVTFGPAAIESDRSGGHPSCDVVWHEWLAACRVIGTHSQHFHGFVPSSSLATMHAQDIADEIFKEVEVHRPDAVFTLSPDDENTAHAVVGRESDRVLRGRVPFAIRCQYPWNFSLGRANLFVSLGDEDLAAKEKVIRCYRSQFPVLQESGSKFRYNYMELLMAAARVDGLSVKVPAAERFELIRGVV